jgi:hypothetical protein
MPVLETIVAVGTAVGTIISIFNHVRGWIKKSQKERERKRLAISRTEQDAETRLIATLKDGPTRINTKQSDGIVRFGSEFGRGDGRYLIYGCSR